MDLLPFILGISSVLASPAAQITQADKNSESAFQLVQLLIGVLLTAARLSGRVFGQTAGF